MQGRSERIGEVAKRRMGDLSCYDLGFWIISSLNYYFLFFCEGTLNFYSVCQSGHDRGIN
jgi:hypothetical protein